MIMKNIVPFSRTRAVLFGNTALVLLIGYIDYITGWELGFFVFYYIPIAIVAWMVRGAAPYVMAVFCAVIWGFTDWASAPHYSVYYVFWNSSIHLIAYLIISYSVSKICTLRNNEKQISDELKKSRDNLERRLAERTRDLQWIHSQLAMKEKMASVGQLAAGIAHELNNPMSFVATNFGTLQDDINAFKNVFLSYREVVKELHRKGLLDERRFREIQAKEDEAALHLILEHIDKLFAESKDGMRRVMGIINSMRDFSRAYDPGEFCSFNINKGIADTLTIARHAYKYHAAVETKLGDIPEVVCVPDMINQVLLNIIVNAAQAIADQKRSTPGCISITTYADTDNVYCEIRDDGPGIPENILARVFEPFFTTKPPGQGTGLGLSISWDIISNKHNGSLTVSNDAGKGAAFLIRLPRNMPERGVT